MSKPWIDDLIRAARLARTLLSDIVAFVEGRSAQPPYERVGRVLIQLDSVLADPNVTLRVEQIGVEAKATVTRFDPKRRTPRRPKR